MHSIEAPLPSATHIILQIISHNQNPLPRTLCRLDDCLKETLSWLAPPARRRHTRVLGTTSRYDGLESLEMNFERLRLLVA